MMDGIQIDFMITVHFPKSAYFPGIYDWKRQFIQLNLDKMKDMEPNDDFIFELFC